MKVISTETYTTSIFCVEYEGDEYIITHREDPGTFVPEWEIEDRDGDELLDRELHSRLLELAKAQLVAK